MEPPPPLYYRLPAWTLRAAYHKKHAADLAMDARTPLDLADVPLGCPAHRDRGGQISLAIHRMRKPVIAAINGSAVGVGITMTLPADVRVVAESAKIGSARCPQRAPPRIMGH